jgi:hypothetical protein
MTHTEEYKNLIEKNPRLQQIEWHMCKNDPYFFLTHYAKTLNNHYKEWEDPTQPFPEKEYIRLFVNEWLEHKILVVPKSRQMMVSWLCVWIYLWDTQFHKARFTCFQSKREEDADELVKRLKHIWDNEPEWMKYYYNEDWTSMKLKQNPQNRGHHVYCKFDLPQINSRVLGLPQWWDIVRMMTLSWMVCDEAAFQPEMDSAYTALKPTLSSGWMVTMVSTAQEGTFFEDCVNDNLKMN